MRRLNTLTLAGTIAVGVFAAFSAPAQAQVTAFEGARIITGDGRVVENGTLVVNGNQIA